MRALVTGATGFVGSAVVRALLDDGWEVRSLVRPSSDARNLEGVPTRLIIGDLWDRRSLDAAVANCDAVFHVAADYRLWAPDPHVLYRTNVEGTRSVMSAAWGAGVPRIVYTSSVATLGHTANGSPADEATRSTFGDMIGHYKRSKFLAEQWVCDAATQGLPAVIVNPSAPVGPRDSKPTPTGRIVLDAAAGRTPAYVNTGLNVVHVDDVAKGHLLALQHGQIGERYILGGSDITLLDLLTRIAGIVGRPPPRIRLPHSVVLPLAYVAEAIARLRGRDTRITVDGARMARHHMYFSSAKAKRVLGYSPRPVQLALEDAIAWFQLAGYLPTGARAAHGTQMPRWPAPAEGGKAAHRTDSSGARFR